MRSHVAERRAAPHILMHSIGCCRMLMKDATTKSQVVTAGVDQENPQLNMLDLYAKGPYLTRQLSDYFAPAAISSNVIA